eukprot:m.176044 g.176044  ORF g.176044 m.176044 type:complete len:288 (-) comp14098_c0_seq1:57-920(-)
MKSDTDLPIPPDNEPSVLPDWFVKYRRPVFARAVAGITMILAIVGADVGHKHQENYGLYVVGFFLTLIGLIMEYVVERRNDGDEMAIRFDLSLALLSYGLMRIQATATENEIYFEVDGFQTAMDLYFFLAFLGAKLVGRTGSREIGMLIIADIVDFIELTFAMRGHGCNTCDNGGTITTSCQFNPSRETKNAIITFTFVFILVTIFVIRRADTAGQKSVNAITQGLFVHFPIICVRAAIPLNLEGMVSFNLIFIAKNVVELLGCAMDFAEAGNSALTSGGATGYQNL